MNEAVRNLVMLMWMASAINSNANAKVVSAYNIEEEKSREVSVVMTDASSSLKQKRVQFVGMNKKAVSPKS